jgi:SAM-dependent methyltransferase
MAGVMTVRGSNRMWDQRYARDTYAYGTQPNDFLRQSAASLPVGRTLCIGEGEGRNAVYLASLGHQVTAVDASLVGLEKARRLAGRNGVEIETIHADLADYEFAAGGWDAIVSIFCHLPPPLRAWVHRQAVKALTPGGVFVLEAYTPDQLRYATGGPATTEMMMDLASLQPELQGLEFLHGVETQRDIHEGEFHQGRGAVVQVIAVRR